MSVDFAGELNITNGAADALLKSLGHRGVGISTDGSMPVAEARRLLDEHAAKGLAKHQFHDDFAEVIAGLEREGVETLEWF